MAKSVINVHSRFWSWLHSIKVWGCSRLVLLGDKCVQVLRGLLRGWAKATCPEWCQPDAPRCTDTSVQSRLKSGTAGRDAGRSDSPLHCEYPLSFPTCTLPAWLPLSCLVFYFYLSCILDQYEVQKWRRNVILTSLTSFFDSCKVAVEAKVKCQQEADATGATISLANRLVGGLASEKVPQDPLSQTSQIWKESNILKLKSSQELTVLIYILFLHDTVENYFIKTETDVWWAQMTVWNFIMLFLSFYLDTRPKNFKLSTYDTIL